MLKFYSYEDTMKNEDVDYIVNKSILKEYSVKKVEKLKIIDFLSCYYTTR